MRDTTLKPGSALSPLPNNPQLLVSRLPKDVGKITFGILVRAGDCIISADFSAAAQSPVLPHPGGLFRSRG